MTYDAMGRVLTAASTKTGVMEKYHYSSTGLRTLVEEFSGTTLLKSRVNIYNDARQLVSQYEKAPAGALTWKRDIVYLGTREAAEYDSQGIHVTMVDHLGTPRLITKANSILEAKQKFLPFGEQIEFPNPYKPAKGFTNHEQTDASGLIYMQARFYHPGYGKFLSPDPARDQHFEDTQSWNIYSYVRNNPIMSTDPTGMVEEYRYDKERFLNTGQLGLPAHAARNGVDGNENGVHETVNGYNRAKAQKNGAESKKAMTAEENSANNTTLTMTKDQAARSPVINYTSQADGRLNGVLYQATYYAMRIAGLDSVTVTAISNGRHSLGGGHYDAPIANAVDIGAINGVPIRANQPLAEAFFAAMTKFLNAQGGAKAAYGPDQLLERDKSGALAEVTPGKRADALAAGHARHQHYSILPQAATNNGPRILFVE